MRAGAHNGCMAHPFLHVTLYQDPHCPFSERVRRALGEKGIYQDRVNVGWHQRDEIERISGTRSTPMMLVRGRAFTASTEIAAWANDESRLGMDLFPERLREAIDEWVTTADRLHTVTLPLAVPVWADVMRDAAEREAFLGAHASLGTYRDLRNARMVHWRAVMDEWRQLERALADRDYLLGDLTYADFAVYGTVYLAAQFHAFEVPQALERLAAWYETIRTAGLMRDQELLLAKERRDLGLGHPHRGKQHYGDPPHHPDDARDQNF